MGHTNLQDDLRLIKKPHTNSKLGMTQNTTKYNNTQHFQKPPSGQRLPNKMATGLEKALFSEALQGKLSGAQPQKPASSFTEKPTGG
jgi:hypothetical protein